MKNWHPVKIMSSPAIKEFGFKKKKKVFKSNPKPGWEKKFLLILQRRVPATTGEGMFPSACPDVTSRWTDSRSL